MKKTIILILAILLAIMSLSSCTVASKVAEKTPTEAPTATPTQAPTPIPTATPEPPYISTIENMSNEELMIEAYNVTHDYGILRVIALKMNSGEINEETFLKTADFTKDVEAYIDLFFVNDEMYTGKVGENIIDISYQQNFNYYKVWFELGRIEKMTLGLTDKDTASLSKYAKDSDYLYSEASFFKNKGFGVLDESYLSAIFINLSNIYEGKVKPLPICAFEGRLFPKFDEEGFEVSKEGLAYVEYLRETIEDICFNQEYDDEERVQNILDKIYNNKDLLDIEKITCLGNIFFYLKTQGKELATFQEIQVDGQTLMDRVNGLSVAGLDGIDFTDPQIRNQQAIDYTGRNNIPDN